VILKNYPKCSKNINANIERFVKNNIILDYTRIIKKKRNQKMVNSRDY